MTVFEYIIFCVTIVLSSLVVDFLITHTFPALFLVSLITATGTTAIKAHRKHLLKKAFKEWEKEKLSFWK